jgi:hypothetical protein
MTPREAQQQVRLNEQARWEAMEAQQRARQQARQEAINRRSLSRGENALCNILITAFGTFGLAFLLAVLIGGVIVLDATHDWWIGRQPTLVDALAYQVAWWIHKAQTIW